MRAATRVNAEQASEKDDVQADPTAISGKADTAGRDERRRRPVAAPGYWRQHVHKESARNTGSPKAWSGRMTDNQTPARERLGARGVAERLVVPLKPGNAGGGKGPQFKTDARRSEGPGDWATYQLRTAFRNCRRRCTRKRRQNPATRFYVLYDKISREDILAHAYAQCRSNKGAPGVDRQDFEAVEGVLGCERWLDELALALRQETYRPDPIRRVYIPKATANRQTQAAGHLNLAGSGLHDSQRCWCWSRSSKPTFHRNSTPTVPGETLEQAVVEVEELAVSRPSGSRGRRRSRTTSGAFPMPSF